MKKLVYIFGVLALLFAGCAQKADNIKASYVSPLKYESYTCEQLKEEIFRINEKTAALAGQQNSTSTKDAVAMTAGVVIFWPALFLLALGDDEKEQIARMKGEYNAIKIAAEKKKCGFAPDMK